MSLLYSNQEEMQHMSESSDPVMIQEKDRALLVFHSFETIMKAFLDMYPEGQISWHKGTVSLATFDGEFIQDSGDRFRITERINNK